MSEYLWCISRSPYLILGDELRFLSGWYQSPDSGSSPSCLPPGYKSAFTYSLLSGFLSAKTKKKKREIFLTLSSFLRTGDGISCWIYLVLHRAQRQYWGKLVCLPAVICLPFPWSICMGPGKVCGSPGAERQRKEDTAHLVWVQFGRSSFSSQSGPWLLGFSHTTLSFFPWG